MTTAEPSLPIATQLEHHRWLLNNGIVSDYVNNNLYMYGSIVHRDVVGLHVEIDVARKHVKYTVFFTDDMMDKIDKFTRWQNSDSIITLWRLRRLIKKEGNLNFEAIVQRFVKDFCGPAWTASAIVDNVSNYKENEECGNGESP
jgi:hypothetical protein